MEYNLEDTILGIKIREIRSISDKYHEKIDRLLDEYHKKIDGPLKELCEKLESKEEKEEPIIKVVNALFYQALKDNASEIHIYSDRRGIGVEYKVGEAFKETMRMPNYVHAPLISRLKIMADLNIAEREKEQEGLIHITNKGNKYDFNLKTIPTEYREKVEIIIKSSV